MKEEFVSGELLHVHSHIRLAKQKVSEQVKQYYAELQSEYRRKFDEYVPFPAYHYFSSIRILTSSTFSWVSSVSLDDEIVQRCASAWYQVPYTPMKDERESKHTGYEDMSDEIDGVDNQHISIVL